MRRSVVRGAAGGVAALGVALFAQPAVASNGLESPDAGAYQVGRGGAWIARADDPLAVYFNPAGLVRQATGVHLGAHLMFLDRCYARKGLESNEDSEKYGQQNQPVSPGLNFAGPGADPPGPEVGPPEYTCAKAAPYPNPQIAANFRVHERVAVGIGLLGPHGVGNVEWPEELSFVNKVGADATQPAAQRYMLVKSESLIFFPTLSAAFAITPELSVGAGFTWGVAIAQFENFSEAFSEAPSKARNCGPNGDQVCVAHDDFARDVRSKLTATDIFVPGLVVGALWSPSRYLDLAGWFRWSDAIDTDASVSTESNYWDATGKKAGGEKCSDPANQDCTITLGEKEGDPGYNAGRLKLNIPMEAKLGVRFHWPRQNPGPRPKWAQGSKTVRDPMSEDLFDVEANFTYANNAAVDNVEVRFKQGININGTPGQLPQNADIPHHWRDVFGVRLGGEYVLLPSLLSLRAGGFYESSGQDPRYLNLDFHLSERVGLSGGASVRLGPVDVTVAYQHTFFGVTDNGGRGALYALSGDAATGEDPNKPGGAFRSYQPINGGQLKSELNEVALGGTLRF